ncbi:hypothetical protein [Miniphocaeibacter massiliensis]|uniref:hypothetical protein n=1 Tax=Miniphocaeibacter massiliensis TaxID=2041841 RepID=UPI001F5CD635|nr:hypothetical protein [Miniphocaeibacter massiliensis]
MEICSECYSSNSRITPVLKAKECLEKHTQYICGTCGRCICIEKDKKRGLRRWNFPFKSLELAILYLRTAEAKEKKICGIYEIIAKNGRKSYKIFSSEEDFKKYLSKNKDKKGNFKNPVYSNKEYKVYPNTEIRKLSNCEIKEYLEEQSEKNCK